MFRSAESEHPMLTNREIIFEEFQPMGSQPTNVTDGRTDKTQTTCDRKTALCTKGHRVVKTEVAGTRRMDSRIARQVIQRKSLRVNRA